MRMTQAARTTTKAAPAAKTVKPAPRKPAAALPLKKPAAALPLKKAAAPAAKAIAAPAKPQAPEVKVAAKPAAPAAAKPAPAAKVVRDGFTMPQADYDLLKTLKAQCLKAGVDVKKSELLRAGVLALAAMPEAQLLDRVRALAPVKTGRKKKKA
jgi:hypothetical protein